MNNNFIKRDFNNQNPNYNKNINLCISDPFIKNYDKVYSKMPGYPFITKCPACENNENITWCHTCDEGLETIDEEGYIHCEKCSLDNFLLDLEYDCGNHNNEYRGPNWKRTIYSISKLATSETLPDNIAERIISKIVQRKNKL